jgi:hypothetical protein
MFCPRCGRRQAQEELRFCNGCGFLLEDVAAALKNEGRVERNVVPAARELKRGVTKALALMTLSAVFFQLSLIMGTPEPSYFVQFNMAVGILCYVFGLVWVVHTFRKNSAASRHRADEEGLDRTDGRPRSLGAGRASSARRLNEPDLSGLVDADALSGVGLKTNELVERAPSVTEGTTKLLEKDSESTL